MIKGRACRATGAVISALAVLLSGSDLSAKTLEVGPNHRLKLPSAAAAIAGNGDIIEIEPGEYADCAVWSASGLTIEGRRTGAVIADRTCEGKGLFITRGNDITIRNLTFARARAPEGNGAGIRVEGKNLTVERSRFIDNENGILAGNSPGSILISGSEFLRNGKCAPTCAHGIYVGHIALLRVTSSKFSETKEGHHIKSRALRTELIGDDIRDGRDGTASYLVDIPNGGSLVMENNTLEKGPHSSNARAAVLVDDIGFYQVPELTFANNRFVNDGNATTIFVLNWSSVPPKLDANRLVGHVVAVSEDGISVHRLHEYAGWLMTWTRRMVHFAKGKIWGQR